MTLRDKTPEQNKEQLIILRKIGQNNEKINSEYKKIIKNGK